MLGTALAWAVATETASRLYSATKKASGTFYSWLRPLLAVTLAGGVLGALTVLSGGNPVLVIGSMCAAGVLIGPFTSLPTSRAWLRVLLILLEATMLLLSAIVVSTTATFTDPTLAKQSAERFGQLPRWEPWL